jgi:hypothetical protein
MDALKQVRKKEKLNERFWDVEFVTRVMNEAINRLSKVEVKEGDIIDKKKVTY